MSKMNFKFHTDHYLKVRGAREKRGLPIKTKEEILDHPLINKQIYNFEEKKVFVIKSAWKHWYLGWYVTLLADNDVGSTFVIWWNNINCHEPIIIEDIELNQKRWSLL